MKKGTHATTAVRSSKFSLKAINDILILEEDAPEAEHGQFTGFQKESVDAIKKGRIVLPQAFEDAVKKYPCRGTVLSIGNKVDCGVKVGDRVTFSRFGGQREQSGGKLLIFLRQSEILAIL